MAIPLIIGVTGHRDILTEDAGLLEDVVRRQLIQLKTQCQHTPLRMLNSLAEGADQLCARIALELEMELIVPLPMALCEYEKDFSGDALASLYALLDKAKDVFVAPDREKKQREGRDYGYRQTGIYIASSSHLLLALWDGNLNDASTCGTGAVVEFMLHPTYACDDSPFKAMSDGVVLQINTPRRSNLVLDEAYSVQILENQTGVFQDALVHLERFNRDAGSLKMTSFSSFLDEETISHMGPISLTMHQHFQQADALSVLYRDKYLHSMLQISILGVLMVLSFLMYNQLNHSAYLMIYGALLVVMVCVFQRTKNGQFQSRYLEYRALSESIRIQLYLELVGIQQNICESLTWPNHPKNVWIRDAVTALLVGPHEKAVLTENELKTVWMGEQLTYHQRKRKGDIKKEALQSMTKKVMWGASLLSFLLVFVLRIFHDPGLMVSKEAVLLPRIFDIFMGVISAAAVFTSNYYGKLSLKRKIADHDKMMALYQVALDLYDHPGIQKKKVFLTLAKESMIENGDWLTYCREETPSLLV